MAKLLKVNLHWWLNNYSCTFYKLFNKGGYFITF